MSKDYEKWTIRKTAINDDLDRPIGIKSRDIWLCSMGENVGKENDGKGDFFVRPVLIMRSFAGVTCYALPLSTTTRRGQYHYPFEGKTGKTSVALLTQLRLVDSARLVRKIGKADRKDFDEIAKRVAGLMK